MSIEIFAALLQVALVEAAEATGKILRATAAGCVRQMPLGMKEVDLDQASQYVTPATPFVRHDVQWKVIGRRLKPRVEAGAIEHVVSKLELPPEPIVIVVTQIRNRNCSPPHLKTTSRGENSL